MTKRQRKSRPHKGSMAKYSPQPQNEDRFHKLFDVLHDYCFKGNWTATARALQISVNTAKAWSNEAPKRYWEIYTLERCIKEVHAYMTAHKQKVVRDRAAQVLGALQAAKEHDMADLLEAQTHSEDRAGLHLISLLAHSPMREMSTVDLFKSGNLGPFKRRTMQHARRQLGIKKHTRGYGEDKETFWYIPRPFDEEED